MLPVSIVADDTERDRIRWLEQHSGLVERLGLALHPQIRIDVGAC